jgi:glycosyltransferase involved in cell wall biosynthesis
MPPLISCVLPVYNGEKYLAEAIGSVLQQAYESIEVIVADDGSTDGTPAIARRFGEQVRYVRQPNAGPAAARNLGVSEAAGAFLTFIDADDLWHPEKLSRQMARFDARPELDFCVAHAQNFWAPELALEEAKFRDHRVAKALPGYVTGTLMARRDFFDAVGPFNPSITHADDTDWFLRAKERGAVQELLPDVLLYRRLHSDNLSRAGAAGSRDQYLQLLKNVLDRRRRQSGTAG